MVDESALGTVVGDMATGRRGMVRAVHVLPQHRLVEAEAPLKELLGYSTLFVLSRVGLVPSPWSSSAMVQ